MEFRKITADDRNSVQSVTLRSGLRNCNFTFANLVGWQPEFGTHYCLLDDAVVLRYLFGNTTAYLVNSPQTPSIQLIDALREDAASRNQDLLLVGLEDDRACQLQSLYPRISTLTPKRDSYDYIYLRQHLENLAGKDLKAKRNHCNRFLAEHPDFHYRPLTPALFPQCLALAHRWEEHSGHHNPSFGDSLSAEKRVLRRLFDNWEKLDMLGGAIFIGTQMVAFTLGAPVTHDTFDICIEKADRSVNGAFNIINQQFVSHLPPQYRFINREEDMGLEGLRKAKTSYHPFQLLSFNTLSVKTTRLLRCTPDDSEETIQWIARQYQFERQEVESWVRNLRFNWDLSVKAVDIEGNTVGLLNMSDYRVEEETEEILKDKPELVTTLGKMKSIAVFSFIVAEEYRHTTLNHQMISHIWDHLQQHYDFIFVPVMHRLHTHSYWVRRGAREFYRDTQSVYYLIPLSEAAKTLTL